MKPNGSMMNYWLGKVEKLIYFAHAGLQGLGWEEEKRSAVRFIFV